MSAASRLPLHTRILIGLGLGIALGLGLHALQAPIEAARQDNASLNAILTFLTNANDFVGDVFMRGLRAIAAPIVLFSVITGASTIDDMGKLGRIGLRAAILYLGVTVAAITIGVGLANLIRPGTFVSAALRDELAVNGSGDIDPLGGAAPDAWSLLLSLVPTNPFESLASGNMLQIVVIAVIVGIAITQLPAELSEPIKTLARGFQETVLVVVEWLMAAAPFAVFALITGVMAVMGIQVIGALFVYALVVVLGIATMMLAVYPLLFRGLGGMDYATFYRGISPAQLLAFSSSSSNATLPVTMECVQDRLGVRKDITSFVLPMGATLNTDGTALYQGVATVFVAQLYGIDLSLLDQVAIVLTATLASIGSAGVPGVGLVMLVVVLQSAHLPEDVMRGGLAVLFSVDRILDMVRTVANITSDCAVTVAVAKMEDRTDAKT